jgi:hypothetical protein
MICTRPAALRIALAMACLLVTSTGGAQQSKCLVGKNKCMAKMAGSLLKTGIA